MGRRQYKYPDEVREFAIKLRSEEKKSPAEISKAIQDRFQISVPNSSVTNWFKDCRDKTPMQEPPPNRVPEHTIEIKMPESKDEQVFVDELLEECASLIYLLLKRTARSIRATREKLDGRHKAG